MARPALEVADIFVAHAGSFLEKFGGAVSWAKRRVLNKLIACRTSLLGGHVDRCDRCDYEKVSYNSCRNRHCPKCQATARAEWLEARARDLLDVEYFHVVFTVPPAIAEIARQNKKVMYGILFNASSQTLKTIAADHKHLGAKIGFLSVLHTWGQNLMHHPHIHCIVPGGGMSPDGKRWVSCPPGFFLPVRVLSAVFRGKFIEMTRRAFANGELQFQGHLEDLDDPTLFEAHLRASLVNEWVVYAKRPFGGPQQVLKYLANYTHRVAISNHRLVSMRGRRVRFHVRDYARGSRKRTLDLDAVEFARRFLLHVLPRGFVRIRHSGFLANACRQEQLARCRELLGEEPPSDVCADDGEAPDKRLACPECEDGRLRRFEFDPINERHVIPDRAPVLIDSS
ncbi:MAG: IS91 family transposase [bacterium]|nr:IS91 family transposase [bacterium]